VPGSDQVSSQAGNGRGLAGAQEAADHNKPHALHAAPREAENIM
jgi:hypothetical protein